MSKYSALGGYLKLQNRDRVAMTFRQIEKVTATKLPASAHKHRPWWSNNPHNSVMTKVWLDAGYESEQVDMTARKLVFRRVRKPKMASEAAQRRTHPFHPAYGHMKGLVRIAPGTDLTEPADPEWANRLDREYGSGQRGA